MPILQSTNPTADILGGLAGLAGTFISQNIARKKAEQDRQDKLKQQGVQNALAMGNLTNNATAQGNVVTGSGADTKVGPWQPPKPDAPSGPTQQPGLAGLLAGLAQPPPQANLGPKAPKLGAPVSDAVMGALPASVTGKQPAAPPDPLAGFRQDAALAQSMAQSQMGIYNTETQQVQTLTQQGAPAVLIKRHQDAAHQALIDSGTWAGKQHTAEQSIAAYEEKNAPPKPTYADLHGTYGELHPRPPQPTWADTHPTYSQQHPQAPRPTWRDLHPLPKTDPSAPSSLENTIYDQASKPGLTQQQSLAIIDNPRNGLNFKQRTAMRQAIRDQKPDTVKKTTEDPDNTTMASQIMQSGKVVALPNVDKADLNTNLRRYGYNPVVSHLKDLVSGKATDATTPPDRARRILQALGE